MPQTIISTINCFALISLLDLNEQDRSILANPPDELRVYCVNNPLPPEYFFYIIEDDFDYIKNYFSQEFTTLCNNLKKQNIYWLRIS